MATSVPCKDQDLGSNPGGSSIAKTVYSFCKEVMYCDLYLAVYHLKFAPFDHWLSHWPFKPEKRDRYPQGVPGEIMRLRPSHLGLSERAQPSLHFVNRAQGGPGALGASVGEFDSRVPDFWWCESAGVDLRL